AHDAVAAPVADVVLDVDGADLGAEDGAGGTRLQAPGVRAVLADVGEEEPSERTLCLAGHGAGDLGSETTAQLLELHVPPGGGAQAARVVVGMAGPDAAVLGHLVPPLAAHLAGLAAAAR